MKQEYLTYPHFVANQVLKSKHLNDSFGFIDEQSRLTRARLLGHGILDGLSFSYSDGVLTVRPGSAVNSRGWMLQIQAPDKFRYAAPISAAVPFHFKGDTLDGLLTPGETTDDKRFLCFKTMDEALNLGFNPVPIKDVVDKKFVVALAFGIRSQSKVCSETSCDVNLNGQVLSYVPILLNGSTLEGFRPSFELKIPISREAYIGSHNRNFMDGIQGLKLYNIVLKQAFNSDRNETINVGKEIFTSVLGQVLEQDTKLKKGVFYGFFPKYKLVLSRFRNALFKIQALKASDKTDYIPDYYLFFLEDIRTAMLDFLEDYTRFAARYEAIPNMLHESDALIYLGSLKDPDKKENRSTYFNVNDESFRSSINRLQCMLERIAIISEQFIGPTMNQGKVTPRKFSVLMEIPYVSLSKRPIPAYYNQNDTLIRYWHIDDLFSRNRIMDYEKKSDSEYLLTRNQFVTRSVNWTFVLRDPQESCLLSGYNNIRRFSATIRLRSDFTSYSGPLGEELDYFYDSIHTSRAMYLRDNLFTPEVALFSKNSSRLFFKKKLQNYVEDRNKLIEMNDFVAKLMEKQEYFHTLLDNLANKRAVVDKYVFTYYQSVVKSSGFDPDWSVSEHYFKLLYTYLYGKNKSLNRERSEFSQRMRASFLDLCWYLKNSYDVKVKGRFIGGRFTPGDKVSLFFRNERIITYMTGLAQNR
jgi:hypothetical protein